MTLESESALLWFTRLRHPQYVLSTGHTLFDDILNGSIPLKSVTEIFAEPGIGKVELLITVVAKLLVNAEQSCWVPIILDFKGSFRTDRLLNAIKHISKCDDSNFGLSLLQRVFIERVYTCEELKVVFSRLQKEYFSSQLIPLVIVNEVGAILSDTTFTEEEGRLELDQVLKIMREFCATCGGTIITTNHVVHWRGYPSPSLGNVWIDGIGTRIALNRDEKTGHLFAFLQSKIIKKSNGPVLYTIGNNFFEQLVKTERPDETTDAVKK